MQNTTQQNGKISGSIFDPAWKGTLKALRTILVLSKIVIPVTFILVTLDKLNWLTAVAGIFQPSLKAFGLPGEAALPLLLGFFVNFYAGIGAMVVLSLSARQITVIGLMILTSHNLLMESPVLKLTGLSPLASMLLRITGALTFGLILNLCYVVFGG